MFLTRIGFGTKAVVTGDITQIDLPRGAKSGLTQIMHILKDVEGIGFTQFANKDVVRHPLVQRIVDAYDKHEAEVANFKAEKEAKFREQQAPVSAPQEDII